ncbi:AMP-binding protein [Paenibacillus sp. N4]|uniref:AMP-binding protein n=1 Tax=Paenibacillus vietnamensis TaxID=2590547 RepID=UPI001CD0FBCD|nr:AMP-binding protein [Paenibacillus vietnamensis]MCA0757540.1 AMP-binding protein [Paenibacillus vietnamensis]
MNNKLFAVNQTFYGQQELDTAWKKYSGIAPFREAGQTGSRIAVVMSDAAELIALVLYLREAGASVLLLHGETPLETAKALAQEAGCKGLVFHAAEGGYWPLAEQAYVTGEAASLCLFSSGTSGKPKLISRSWSSAAEEIAAYNEAIGLDAGVTPVVISPVSHAYGLIAGVLSAMERKAVPHIATYTNPKLTLALLRDTPNHIVYGVPLTLHVLTSLASGFRFNRLMSSGAPMPQGLLDNLTKLADRVLQQYGCSEAGCISINGYLQASGDIGRPLGHIRILEAGTAHDSPKEIVIETGGSMIRTGDLGYMESGELKLLARVDDVINVAGLKVYPAEVENIISALEGIRECVVYRGRHPVMGEIVCCMVAVDGKVTPDEVRAWCLAKLPPYKVPAKVECVDKLPRTATGKISRKLLEEANLSQ